MIVTKQVKKSAAKTPDVKINGKHFKGVGVLSWHRRHTEYYQFSPFYLKTDGKEIVPNEGGHIFENYWQGLKVYPTVTKQDQYTHYTKKGDDRFLVWRHPYQRHLITSPRKRSDEDYSDSEEGELTDEYFEWREKLWNNPKSVRYPNGFQGRHRCKFALVNDERLGYVEFRKKVYFREYIRLVRNLDLYQELLDYLSEGGNIIIYEIDVPAEDKKGLYGEVDENGFWKCSRKKLKALLNSEDAPFGHGLCLAYSLLSDLKKLKSER